MKSGRAKLRKSGLNRKARLTVIMTANETIYLINQNSGLLKAWRELTDAQKRALIKACEKETEESDIERIIEEIVDGQRRLFR